MVVENAWPVSCVGRVIMNFLEYVNNNRK